jgi:hypothetical protein
MILVEADLIAPFSSSFYIGGQRYRAVIGVANVKMMLAPFGLADSAHEISSLNVWRAAEFKFDRIRSDPAHAPERRGFQT